MENINCLQCKFRHPDNGNCMEVGGFCTAVPAAYCPLLRKYLGTLMTPEQVANAKTIIESAFAEDTSKAERIRKLLAADKDGRCVVLPCKVGDTVWIVGAVRKLYSAKVRTFFCGHPSAVRGDDDGGHIHMIRTTECDIPMQEFGKTVFLSREEAEKALQEMESKKDDKT